MEKSLEGITSEQAEQMAAMYQALLANPETREITLRATRKINPKLQMPELEVLDRTAAALKTRDDRAAKIEQDLAVQRAENKIRDERERLRDDGFSREDITAIEKIMQDEKIASYDLAARFFKGSQTIAEPTPAPGAPAATYSMPLDPLNAMKGGKKKLNEWARNEGAAAINDILSGRVKLAA